MTIYLYCVAALLLFDGIAGLFEFSKEKWILHTISVGGNMWLALLGLLYALH